MGEIYELWKEIPLVFRIAWVVGLTLSLGVTFLIIWALLHFVGVA